MFEKVKILYLINNMGRGGTEKQLYLLIKYLSRNVFETMVITVCGSGDNPVTASNINIYDMEIKGSIIKPFNFKKIYKAIKIVKRYRPCIIHSWLFHSNLIAAIMKVLMPNVKLVTSKRGSNFWYTKKHFFINKFVYRISDSIVVNADSLKEEIGSYNNIESKIKIIHNGIESHLTYKNISINPQVKDLKKKDKIIIGCVGRFVPEKRYEDVIHACKIIIKKYSNIHFVLVGGRGGISKYRRMVDRNNLNSYITFTGEVNDVLPFIKGFDIFLNASSFEGLPNAILEAMLMGKPIIATRVGGIPELIKDGENGVLINPCHPEEIVNAIEILINNEKMRRKIAQNNLEKIKNFSVSKMVSQIEKLYFNLLS